MSLQLTLIGIFVAQLGAVWHAVRHRHAHWIFLLLFLPGLGLLLYGWLKMWPGPLSARANRLEAWLETAFFPEKELSRLEREAAASPALENQLALACAYVRHGNPEAATSLLYRLLQEPAHEGRLDLWESLALAAFHAEDYALMESALNQRSSLRSLKSADTLDLLAARALEARGKLMAAKSLYESLLNDFAGEEAAYRYALLLQRLGETQQARHTWQALLERLAQSPAFYQRSEQKWADLALSSLKKV